MVKARVSVGPGGDGTGDRGPGDGTWTWTAADACVHARGNRGSFGGFEGVI